MTELALAFGLVFVAELGDKSMLLAIGFAARYRPWPVVAGVAIAALTMLGVSTLVGAAIGAALPERLLTIGGGVLFVGFGVWTLLDDDEEEDGGEVRGRSVLLGVTAAFLVAELGDKTMLATVALASTQAPVATWLGASAGMTAASAIAIAVASYLGGRLPDRVVRLAAAAAFVLFGVLLLWEGLVG